MSMLNAIAVEAYKKYVLVSLIVNGQVHFQSALSSLYCCLMQTYRSEFFWKLYQMFCYESFVPH